MTRAQNAAWVRPLEIRHDVDTGEHHVLVEFRSVDGGWRQAVVRRGQIDDPRGAKRLLADLGADIPDDWLDPLKAALQARGCLLVRSTSVMGWHEGGTFLLPDGPIGRLRTLRPMRPAPAELCTRGKVSTWRKGLRAPCAGSSYLTFAIAVGFAGCLLEPVGQEEGAVFHLFGESSTGKSLATLAAQSVIEKAGRSHMRSHDLTDRALEEEAAACNHSLLVLDETGRIEGTPARRLQRLQAIAYKLCGGQGRRRSQKAVADPTLRNVAFRIFGLSSGEEPLDGGPQKRNDGEQVRLIGIPIPRREDGGIFDHETSGEQRGVLARQVEEAICAAYGVPVRRFLRKFLSDGKATSKAKAYAERFVAKVVPATTPFADRFARKFAVVYAAAMLAVDFGMAPWTKKQARLAIRMIHRRAWQIVRPPAVAADDLIATLRKQASDEARFPEVGQGEKVSSKAVRKLYGIRREVSGRPVIALLRDRLDRFVPAHQAKEVEAILADRGYLLPGKEPGRRVRQLRVQGLQPARPDFLLFDAEKVLQRSPEANSDAA